MPLLAMPEFLILFIIALLFTCIGFKRFIWFISIGFGFSCAAIGVALLIMSLTGKSFSIGFLILCLLLILYGLRLGGFLMAREMRNKAYRARLRKMTGSVDPPLIASICMWPFCSAIFVCQTSPLTYRLVNHDTAGKGLFFFIGIIFCAAGFVIETIADSYKSSQKVLYPNKPVMTGLFRLCRCPNYFGELLFWTGLLLTGIRAVSGKQWIIALIGYLGILITVFAGTRRIEKNHIKNYGKSPEYRSYADSTPILIPYVPLYHIVNVDNVEHDLERAARKSAKNNSRK